GGILGLALLVYPAQVVAQHIVEEALAGGEDVLELLLQSLLVSLAA
ncbi:MAG: hypothetical protein IIC99_06165, partial [Chloroflexi bacterium]|nr:hypothetical protein [Chloroflexota bacterium]